jgi:hypothetical protein
MKQAALYTSVMQKFVSARTVTKQRAPLETDL